MIQTPKIGAGQLFLFLFLSRIILTLTYGMNSGSHTLDNADWLAALLLPAVLLILGIPAFALLKVSKGTTVCDYAYTVSRPVGTVIAVLYALFFLALSFSPVARFSFFVTSAMQMEQPIWFFPVLILLPVCYAAVKGLRAIMRAGTLLAVFCIGSMGAILLVLIPRFDMLNVISPLYHGWGQVGRSLLIHTGHSLEIGVLLMLAPYVRGSLKGTYVGYALATPAFLGLVFFGVVAVLGSYGTFQMFPFYAAAGVAKIGELSNLSALEASVWIIGVFLKSAMNLYLCFQCLSRIIPRMYRTPAMLALTVLGIIAAVYSSGTLASSQSNFSLPAMLGFQAFFLIVLPLALVLMGAVKRRKSHEKTPASAA